jgi:hypothetical protein
VRPDEGSARLSEEGWDAGHGELGFLWHNVVSQLSVVLYSINSTQFDSTDLYVILVVQSNTTDIITRFPVDRG